LVALVAWSGTALQAAESVKAEAEKPAAGIDGLWRAVSVEQGDEKLPAESVRRLALVINEKTIAMWQATNKVAETPYRLDATKEPAQIELTFEGQPTHGICQRTDDTLKLCLADADEARPKKFVVGGEGGQMLMVFKSAEGERRPLYAMNADGTGQHRLVAMPEYTAVGSPAWSNDGQRFGFDAWRAVFGETYVQAHVFVANADGTGIQDLGDGAMPSWSPDGKRLGFSRYSPNRGVWLMSADGTKKDLLDENGWAIEWCPKGNRVAYTVYRDDNANILVRDLDKKDDPGRTLLTKAYQQVYWGMTWSPDGQWIAFRGVTPDGKAELAAVHVDGQEKGFKVLLPKAMPGVRSIHFTVAWAGDGQRVLAVLSGPNGGPNQLYFLDFTEKAPPQLVPGQDPQCSYSTAAWSLDGKKLLLCVNPPKTTGN
jgi:uncharacterized protein (TIGR03067 family)